MLETRVSNGIPSTGIHAERPPELIIISPWRSVQRPSSIGSSTTKCMGERLVLRSHGGNRVRRRNVRALEIGGGEIRDAMSDGGGELSNRLLNLGRVVV